MDLFVCGTTYQLLNAITICIQSDIKADILVYNPGLENSCNLDALRDLDIFQNIYKFYSFYRAITDETVKDNRSFYANRLKKIINYTFAKKYFSDLPNRSEKYDKIYLGYADYFNKFIYYYYKKKGDKSFILYEDGTYTYSCLSIKQSIVKRIGEKILWGDDFYNECTDIWVRNIKELDLGKYTHIAVHEMDKPTALLKYEDALLAIFRASKSNIKDISRKFIFFDQNIGIRKIQDTQIELVNLLRTILPKDVFIVKMHPSSKEIRYKDVDVFMDKVPFEILMALCDIENTVLISVFSTACFTPKLVYNIEPTVILLYSLAGLEEYDFFDNRYLNIINKVRRNYKDSGKICVPSKIDQLESILNRINGNE